MFFRIYKYGTAEGHSPWYQMLFWNDYVVYPARIIRWLHSMNKSMNMGKFLKFSMLIAGKNSVMRNMLETRVLSISTSFYTESWWEIQYPS